MLIHPDHEDAGSISVGPRDHRSTGIHDSSRDDGHTATTGPRFADDPHDEVGTGRRLSSEVKRRATMEQQVRSVEKPNHGRFVVSPESPGFEQYTRDAMDALAHLACQMLT